MNSETPDQVQKLYIKPDDLRRDSHTLAAIIAKSGFKPDFMIAIWRGGSVIGCYVHEFLKYTGQTPDHIAIRTSRYTGIDKASNTVKVFGLDYLKEQLTADTTVVLVDDVYDTGQTMAAVKRVFKETLLDNCPTDMRVATVYYKPTRNEVGVPPDYYVHTTDQWLVFPHELDGLTLDEIDRHVDSRVAQLLRTYTKM